jgi:hypothetical protein
MARHSSIDELKPGSAAIRSLRAQGVRPDGYGYDYRKFECFPGGPPLAKFLRRYVTLREALMRLRAESPNRKEQKPFFRAVCDATLAGLGSYPWNYERAEDRLCDWCEDVFRTNGFRDGGALPSISDAKPAVAVAAELGTLISGLIIAYADPHRFFGRVAPRDSPSDFDAARLSSADWLGRTLWTWGFGALLNEDVRRAFDAATPSQLIEIIGKAEGREKYREGNPLGSGKGKAKKKRVNSDGLRGQLEHRATEIELINRLDRGGKKLAVEEVSKAEGRSVAAIQKRVTRASNK